MTNNNIERIREAYEGRMNVACEDSAKISALIRYFAISGFALVWLLLEPKNGLMALKMDKILQTAVFLLCVTIIFELLHLGASVTVNLYYATHKLKCKVSYVQEPNVKKSQMIPTKFPKGWLCFQWGLWYLKVLTLVTGYILICIRIFA